jgi:hypothetical protein
VRHLRVQVQRSDPYPPISAARFSAFSRFRPLDPADIARLTPFGHATINLQGRYRTTSRAPLAGLRPLRTK